MIARKREYSVLIVDDSPVVRRVLRGIVDRDPYLKVIAEAADPYQARDHILKHRPDVITLDIEMPRMDGLTFLKILSRENPIPVVIISSLSQRGSKVALEALSRGAVEVFGKPSGSGSVPQEADLLRQKIRTAAEIGSKAYRQAHLYRNTGPATVVRPGLGNRVEPRQLLLLGASTGGTEALAHVMSHMPSAVPGILIVQHLPPVFTTGFADRLNRICPFAVKEAEDGDLIAPGYAFVAPGNYHMAVRQQGIQYRVKLSQTPPVWHQRPAVDILFQSAARLKNTHITAALLTGMGKDGAEGMLALKNAGAATLAEDESTCVVFGMPRAALECGATQRMVPLHRMARALEEQIVAQKAVTI